MKKELPRVTQDRYLNSDVVEFMQKTVEYALCNFFGATAARIVRGGDIELVYENISPDKTRKEICHYSIDPSKEPEENLEIIRAARAQQRWYESQRSGEQSAPYIPGQQTVAATQGGAADDEQQSDGGQQDAAA